MSASPFDMVYTELWNMALSHGGFVRDVLDKNRIRFDDPANRDPLKNPVQAADLPEVQLAAATGSVNLQNTSSSSMITRQYTWFIASGDYRYTQFMSAVEWYLFCAMTGWKSRLTALKWKNEAFVKRANVVSTLAGMSDPQRNRNIVGWSAAWTVEVEMHFKTSDLLDELRNTSDMEN